MTRQALATAVGSALLLAACGGGEPPSDQEARAALAVHYDELPPSICLSAGPLPATFTLGTGRADLDALGRYEALASARLVAETRTAETDDDGNPRPGIVRETFAATPAPGGGAAPAEADARFCYARPGIARIERVWSVPFAPPGTFRVRYSYRATDIAPWAATAAIGRAFPDIPRLIVSPTLPVASSVVKRADGAWSYAGE